ncbi:outer membrane protein assembly factor BamC [Nitrosomonadaceae bacterium]|nr:outer membrane protein assembly factor BamC [Nitrosomonadaceae bacterium]
MSVSVSGCAIYNVVSGNADQNELEYETVIDKTPPLEVPPDLTGPATEGRYIVPDLKPTESKTYSAYSKERADGKNGVNTRLLPENSDESMVRMERSGTQRWLVVKGEPEIVWPIIKGFWKEMGFGIKVEIPEAGVIETDWAENRAVTPQNILLRKVSTIELDKFRTRLERGDGETTEIFISHRRMEQPADPDLEAEMLAQLIMYFGVAKDQARAIVNSVKIKDRAHLNLENKGVLTMEEAFDRSWRRVGLALDRIGFTVEDRDRSAGIYFVRYVDPENKINVEPGAWDKFLPWKDDNEDNQKPVEYRIQITEIESGCEVMVVNVDGSQQKSDVTDRILNLLYEQLR